MMKMNRKTLWILALLGVLLIGKGSLAEAQESLAEIYAKYNQAIKSGDIKEINKYLLSNSLMQRMIQIEMPKEQLNYEVVREKIELDKGEASLYLKRENSNTPYGLVTFIKENGTWKIKMVSWSSSPFRGQYKTIQDYDITTIPIASFLSELNNKIDITKNKYYAYISELKRQLVWIDPFYFKRGKGSVPNYTYRQFVTDKHPRKVYLFYIKNFTTLLEALNL